ncbi:hypothetical protein BIW11_12383 [Tropilaelaps mercedesae]|uniref:Uncharacterized protein n=1 Tax=Tropilaelaps mercedesae TaxID=418985 RepID=A0A1V9X7A5_9ACAR|nr:hypothetical protein BIW11_12383 [Tropilaelaps mercedesae]
MSYHCVLELARVILTTSVQTRPYANPTISGPYGVIPREHVLHAAKDDTASTQSAGPPLQRPLAGFLARASLYTPARRYTLLAVVKSPHRTTGQRNASGQIRPNQPNVILKRAVSGYIRSATQVTRLARRGTATRKHGRRFHMFVARETIRSPRVSGCTFSAKN